MNARVLGLLLAGLVAATGLLLWGTSVPLGVDGEWIWPRLPGTAETLVGGLAACFAGSLYVAFLLWGRRRIDDRSRAAVAGQVLLLIAAGFAWLWTIQQCVPAPADLGKVPYVLFYPRSSGYFWQARHKVTDISDFLAHYEELLAEQDYLHIGTHPPGLTLGYRGLIALCEASPGLCDVVLATCPASVMESLQTIATLSAQSGQTATPADQAVLWLAALITLLAAAGTTAGMYVIVRRHFDRATAWTVAGLWPLAPAIAVFYPKSDVLYPLIAVTAAALWLTALDRHSPLRALAAGLVLWSGMLLSLAFVTVGLLMSVMTGWEWAYRWTGARSAEERPKMPSLTGKQMALLLLAGACGFVVPTLLMGAFFEINLVSVWRWNLANHALFYEHNVRTWWKWLLVNPWELALAVGLPVALVAGLSVWRLMRSRSVLSGRAAISVGFLLVWGLLWLSGKNMGEGARLWILLMPWAVMSTAPFMESGLSRSPSPGGRAVSLVLLILAAQMLVCVLTVLRIDGFQFTELVESVAAFPAK